MSNKRQILLTKIDLLNISLEAIIYNKTKSKSIKKFISMYNVLKKNKNHKLYNFVTTLRYIKQLKIITQEYSINIIAANILREYTQNSNQNIASKYNNKFNSIYIQNKKDNYYKNKKLLSNTYQIDIEQISLLNLYILTKITRRDGTFILIKYFYK